MDTKFIESILNDMSVSDDYVFKNSHFTDGKETTVQYLEALNHLIKYGFVDKFINNHGILTLSEKGIEVINSGGWDEYNKKERIKKKQADDKAYYEYMMAKWKHKSFFPLLVFSALAGVYSTIEIIGYLAKSSPNTTLEKPIESEQKLQPKSRNQPEPHKVYPPAKIADTISDPSKKAKSSK